MSTLSNTTSAISVFNGEDYHIWAVKMRFYLRSQGLWNVVVSESDPPPLTTNPIITHMKAYEEEKLRTKPSLAYILDLQIIFSSK
jgi:hypothetical protein